MALNTIEEGKQQYTLKCKDRETGQEVLCSYLASPILTTEHDELIQYAANLAVHHGKNKIYTVCFVTPIHLSPLALPTEHSNMKGIEYKPDDSKGEDVLVLGSGMKEIPIGEDGKCYRPDDK